MGSRLINNLTFTNILADTQSAQAHGLNITGLGIIPDLVQFDNPAFDMISCTATTITVINRGGATASCDVRVTYDHSIQRAFGNTAVDALAPTPFVDRGSSGSAGFQAVAGKMTKSATQTVADTASVVLTFDAVAYDNAGSMVNISTERFIIPVAGIYLCTALVEWDAAAAVTGTFALLVGVNGTGSATARNRVSMTTSLGHSNVVTSAFQLAPGEFINFIVTQASGAGRDIINGEATIQRVS